MTSAQTPSRAGRGVRPQARPTGKPAEPQSQPKLDILGKVSSAKKVYVKTGFIYADPGKGKTHLLCTAQEVFPPERVLIITFDRYDETLEKFPNVHVLDILSINGTTSEKMASLVSELRIGPRKYDFIGYDSISKRVRIARREIVAAELAKDKTRFPNSPEKWHDPDIPEQRDHQRVGEVVYGEMSDLRDVCINKQIHLFIVAWERSEYVETGQFTGDFYYPDMPPELSRVMAHDFSFVSRLIVEERAVSRTKGGSRGGQIVKEETRVLVSHGNEGVYKNRVGFLDRLENPTVRKMLGVESKQEVSSGSPDKVQK